MPRPLVPDFPEDIDYDLLSREPCSGQLEQSILHDSEKVQIIVNHIDENDLLLRKKLIEESVLQQKSFLLEHEKLKSIDVIWRSFIFFNFVLVRIKFVLIFILIPRENLARERILDMEEEAKKRIAIERYN